MSTSIPGSATMVTVSGCFRRPCNDPGSHVLLQRLVHAFRTHDTSPDTGFEHWHAAYFKRRVYKFFRQRPTLIADLRDMASFNHAAPRYMKVFVNRLCEIYERGDDGQLGGANAVFNWMNSFVDRQAGCRIFADCWRFWNMIHKTVAGLQSTSQLGINPLDHNEIIPADMIRQYHINAASCRDRITLLVRRLERIRARHR